MQHNRSRQHSISAGHVLAVVAVCAALLMLCSPSFADGWFTPQKLYTTMPDGSSPDTSIWLELTPSYAASSTGYDYSYLLRNFTGGSPLGEDIIESFALTFRNVTEKPDFTDFVLPFAWEKVEYTPSSGTFYYEILWRLKPEYDPVDYGLKATNPLSFGFSSALPPSNAQIVVTSGVSMRGYSGYTYGPVQQTWSPPPAPEIPEASSILLAISGLGSVLALRPRCIGTRRR